MALTSGQVRWLDRQVGIRRDRTITGVVTGSVIDGDERVVQVAPGGTPGQVTFRVPAEVTIPTGDDASVVVEGRVTGWERGGSPGGTVETDTVYLVIEADNGRYLEMVTPPRTPAEEAAFLEKRNREVQAETDARNAADAAERDRVAQAQAARKARVTKLRDSARTAGVPELQVIVAALVAEVFRDGDGPVPDAPAPAPAPTDPTPPPPGPSPQ